jgi:protein SCO1/2
MLLVPTLVLFVAGYYLGQIFIGEDEANETISQSNAPQVSSQAEPSGVAFVDPPVQVTDFSLMEDTGDPVRLSDMRGKVVILFFGYTNCPDICPTTLQDLTVVKEALGEDSGDVEFVFISVDYERDDPQEVAQFLSYFDEEFIGLVGNQETLSAIGREYGLVIERENINVQHEHEEGDEHELSEEFYFVQHTSPTFLIDRDGYLRQVYFYGTDTDLIAESIQQVVNNSTDAQS